MLIRYPWVLTFSLLSAAFPASADNIFKCRVNESFELNPAGNLSKSVLSEFTEFSVDPTTGLSSFMNQRYLPPTVVSPLMPEYPVVITYFERLSPMGAPYQLNIETRFAETDRYPFFIVGGALKLVSVGNCSPTNEDLDVSFSTSYYLNLASFRDERNANALVSDLSSSGFDSHLERENGLIRVLVHAGASRQDAETLRQRLKSEYSLEGIIIRRVGKE